MKWAERAVADPYVGGQENFTTLATLARLQSLFGGEPDFTRKAAMVCGNVFVAQALAQMPRHSLGKSPSVDEHECCFVFAD